MRRTAGRRAVVGAAMLGASSARAETGRLPVPPGGQLAFRVMRQGSMIGEHHLTFTAEGGAMTMRADVEIVVRLIGVPVFRFAHHAVEHWQGGRLVAFASRTNDDGRAYWVQAQREPAGLAVSASAVPRYTAPTNALPMTHWNRAELGVPKINPERGDLLRPVVTDRGVTLVPDAYGGTIAARRYNFSGEATLDVWFDTDDRWAALAFLGGDQSPITLERIPR